MPIKSAVAIAYSETKAFAEASLAHLYTALEWSSGADPALLARALASSPVVTAWDGDTLVGLASTLSDGHLVVHYSHLLVHPDYQHQGIGSTIVDRLKAKYGGFHQHILVAAAGDAMGFNQTQGFEPGSGTAMWQVGFEL